MKYYMCVYIEVYVRMYKEEEGGAHVFNNEYIFQG